MLQFNPRRIANVEAPISPGEVAGRPCFLCTKNRPAAQESLSFQKRWLVLCNPFPLLERHLVIIDREHTPQRIDRGTLAAMLDFTRQSGFTTLYNGPRCGASAPDHLHIQALPPGSLPLEQQIPAGALSGRDAEKFDPRLPRRIFLQAGNHKKLEKMFFRLVETWNTLENKPGDEEPMMNVVVLPGGSEKSPPLVVVHPRGRHRPPAYYAEGTGRLVISPGAADMAGLVIVPRREDFARLDGHLMRGIFREVCLGPDAFSRLATRFEKAE